MIIMQLTTTIVSGLLGDACLPACPVGPSPIPSCVVVALMGKHESTDVQPSIEKLIFFKVAL